MENQPETTNSSDQILPEEPYAQHYADLEKSKQENEAKEEAVEAKTDTKKGFASARALLATGALALALPVGIAMHDKYQDENRFPDNYKPAPQEQTYVEASHSVIPGVTAESLAQQDLDRRVMDEMLASETSEEEINARNQILTPEENKQYATLLGPNSVPEYSSLIDEMAGDSHELSAEEITKYDELWNNINKNHQFAKEGYNYGGELTQDEWSSYYSFWQEVKNNHHNKVFITD